MTTPDDPVGGQQWPSLPRKPEQASKVEVRMPTRLQNGEGRVTGEAIDTCTRFDPPG